MVSKPNRYTPEKQQELISRNQLCERLVEFGWIPSSPEDLGEDFIVHIYFKRRATGVTFHLQLKSITNLNERRKDEFLRYDGFKVKDLKHWEDFNLPVALFVWDIKLREGRWILLKDAIQDLDQRRPQWRTNKSNTRIYIPWNNTTGDKDLTRLRYSIGKHMLPVIGKNRELNMTMQLSFLGTEEGRKTAEAFEKFYEEGEEVTFRGNIVQEVELPDWAEPWLNTEYDENVEITLRSQGSSKPLPVDIYMIGNNGKTASIKNIELKTVRSGRQLMQLSNAHQSAAPILFEFIFSSLVQCSASVQVRSWGNNVHVTSDILKFQQAMVAGGKLQLILLNEGTPLPVDVPVPPVPQMEPTLEFLDMVDELCLIQDKTGQLIKIPVEIPTEEDVRVINELATIVKNGKVVIKYKKTNGRFEIANPSELFDNYQQGKPISFTTSYERSYAELFGQTIEMGPMFQHFTGILDMSASDLEEALEIHHSGEKFLPLQLVNVEVVFVYSDWLSQEQSNFPVKSSYR